MSTLILGSSSPRRKEILGAFNLPFTVARPPFDEESVVFEGDPLAYVKTLANGKADSLAPQFPDSPILTADTIVYYRGKVYNKPRDLAEARAFLYAFVGHPHSVFTGVTLHLKGQNHHLVEETKVFFNPLTEDEIHSYLDHMEWHDKAGGYAIQAAGGLLVKKIEGCYHNVIGLPINSVRELLLKAGIDLWHCIRSF
jgi:septum formation protein